MSYRPAKPPFELNLDKLFSEAFWWCNIMGVRVPVKKVITDIGICSRKDFLAITDRYDSGLFQITVSTLAYKQLGHDEDKWIDLFIHELLHTVKGCYNHGKKWKHLVERMNKATRNINPYPYAKRPRPTHFDAEGKPVPYSF